MKFQLENAGRHLISQYADGVISIDGVDHVDNVLITATGVIDGWYDGDAHALTIDDFAPLTALDVADRPEIVVLGTGATHVFPDMSLLADMRRCGMALEVMGTRAACRTYSVLINEYRAVAAALLQIRPAETTP